MNLISMSSVTFKVRGNRYNGNNLEPRSQKATSLSSAISHSYNWENYIYSCLYSLNCAVGVLD